MKKTILFAFLVIFSLSAFAGRPDSEDKSKSSVVPDKKENKLSEEEINRLNGRGEEVRYLDNSKQTVIVQEGRRGRRGHGGMNRGNRRNNGVVFVGSGAALILIIILIFVLA
jgi:hypothetical protein